jgi:hypothetical protein
MRTLSEGQRVSLDNSGRRQGFEGCESETAITERELVIRLMGPLRSRALASAIGFQTQKPCLPRAKASARIPKRERTTRLAGLRIRAIVAGVSGADGAPHHEIVERSMVLPAASFPRNNNPHPLPFGGELRQRTPFVTGNVAINGQWSGELNELTQEKIQSSRNRHCCRQR